jgi:cytoskeletal protein RodZ
MTEDAQRLGEVFQTKRSEMNLTLKEVENATSIRMIYLQYIEEGKCTQYLSPVYTLGFIRQYATFLGLNPDTLNKEYPNAFRMKKEKQEFDYGIGTLESRNSNSGSARWMPNLIWGGGILLILLSAWYFAKFLGVL